MLKVTLIISALVMTDSGPTPVPTKRFEQKDLVTCLESVKSFTVAAEEAILSSNSPVVGSMAGCILEYQKPEGQAIQTP